MLGALILSSALATMPEALLFADEPHSPKTLRCEEAPAPARTPCLISLRYRTDAAAAKVAMGLYERTGSIAGLTPVQDFDGGFRGTIRLVPDLPTGPKRKHLEWVALALDDFDAVLGRLAKDSPPDAPGSQLRGGAFNYRWRSLEVGFFRSIDRRTPAAWAVDWGVNYNTNGTLNWGPDIVRELLFHEVFHLNDQAHRGWSVTALTPLYETIVARCGSKKACLEPWAPMETTTRGTYYAFLPANGVREYAAELASRYYREQRTLARGGTVVRPFKCRTEENARAWALLVDEFFGGVDLVPACRERSNIRGRAPSEGP